MSYKASVPIGVPLEPKDKYKNVTFSIEVSAATLAELRHLVDQALADNKDLLPDLRIKSGWVDFATGQVSQVQPAPPAQRTEAEIERMLEESPQPDEDSTGGSG